MSTPAPMAMHIVNDGIRQLTIHKGFTDGAAVGLQMKVHDREINVLLDVGAATLLMGMLVIYLREIDVNKIKK